MFVPRLPLARLLVNEGLCVGIKQQIRMRQRAGAWYAMISPSDLFFIGSTHIKLESILWRII